MILTPWCYGKHEVFLQQNVSGNRTEHSTCPLQYQLQSQTESSKRKRIAILSSKLKLQISVQAILHFHMNT